MELIRPLIREEEQRDFVDEVYILVRKKIEMMLTAEKRQEERLKPTKGK